jgi:hypothetical protein
MIRRQALVDVVLLNPHSGDIVHNFHFEAFLMCVFSRCNLFFCQDSW